MTYATFTWSKKNRHEARPPLKEVVDVFEVLAVRTCLFKVTLIALFVRAVNVCVCMCVCVCVCVCVLLMCVCVSAALEVLSVRT